MSKDILNNIKNAAYGQPYNGAGIPANRSYNSANIISRLDGNGMKLGNPMKLIHSLDGFQAMRLYESDETYGNDQQEI